MQLVYISNRPKMMLETLKHVSTLMPFVTDIVICVPDASASSFQEINCELPIRIVLESDLMAATQADALKSIDHQSRNYLIRNKLVKEGGLNDEFIMSDDDARPLKEIKLACFTQDNRHHSYYYYELKDWENNRTEFDAGQIHTYALLDYFGLPHKSYASHMPQIIDRNIFIEAGAFFEQFSRKNPICEWSSYFNYAAYFHPQKFHTPSFYATLCWPENPLAWKQYAAPTEHLFENTTPNNYLPNGVFFGLDDKNPTQTSTTLINIEKLLRWRIHQINLKHPEQSTHWKKYLNPRTWVNKLFAHN